VTPPSQSKVYVNGGLQLTTSEGVTPFSDTLRLFKDDGSEESAGAVSCIRVYSGVLSAIEVAAIGSSPTCGAVTSPPKTKCKKHKRKHRSAESAKKKKCKKKKKG
jgi:hypothetical protein